MVTIEKLGNVASSQHILIADSAKVLSMEISPLGNCFLEPSDDGFIAHTNHFIENKYVVVEPLWLKGSPARLERANLLASDLVGDLKNGFELKDGIGEILRERIFSDMLNTPQAICRQEDLSRPWQTRSSTLSNIVMSLDAENPSAEIVFGKPGMTEGAVLKMPWT